MFEIPADLAPQCAPLAFLLGTWRGEGVGGYPTIDDFRFEQEVTFTQNGKPFLAYTSRSWILDAAADGTPTRVRPAATETGFWRPQPDGRLEVLLSHPTGFAEIWEGTVEGPRITLRTDMVARTESAKEYAAGSRLYGLVEGDLMWAFDMSAMGEQLQPHLSARLTRSVPSAEERSILVTGADANDVPSAHAEADA